MSAEPAVDPRTWAAPPPSGVRRFVPILRWLPRYDRRWLRFDVIAGATVWGLLVPESIAYAGLAGLPPQAGLYTLLVTLAAYAVFGTSRHLIAAATSAAAVLLASSVGGLAGSDASRYASDAAVLVIFCGGLFLVAGVLRLGFVAQFLSRPVIEGFVFGLAIFVTVGQLPKLFGIKKGSGDTIAQFVHLIAHLGDTSAATLAVGAGALGLLFAVERLAPKIPGGLVALVLGILLSSAFSLSSHGVKIVGHVPSGLPTPGVPSVHSADIAPLVAAAGGMLLVIFSESLGAANTFATKYGYEIDPNQELIALGVANLGSGLVGGLAGGGSLSQSAVNEGAGARSELSPLIAAALIVVTVLVLTPLFKNLPEAVLAALIIHAVSHLWKIAEMRRYYNLRQLEFWLALATFIGVITIDVLPGLVIGVSASLLLVVYHASRPHIGSLGRVPGEPGAYGDVGRHPDYNRIPDLLVLRLESPLFYANATPVLDRIKALVGACDPPPRTLILDFGANDRLDITAAEMLDELVRTMRSARIDVALADARQPVIRMARRAGLVHELGDNRVFHTIDAAVQALGGTADRPSLGDADEEEGR
ncbi:MAG TPA: SulP family inorganic anion transporter [Solirubrobacteraceae bacterium]